MTSALLPTTALAGAASTKDWQPDFLRVSAGLRGVCILWVMWQHVVSGGGGLTSSIMLQTAYLDRMQFNTATFLIIAGFSTHVQSRGAELRYGRWVLSKWFGLVPLSLLCLLLDLPMIARSAQLASVSAGTQVYVLAMHFLGLGWLGSMGDFGYLWNVTAFNDDATFGATGTDLLGFSGNVYFSSLLFMSLLTYAALHALFSSRVGRIAGVWRAIGARRSRCGGFMAAVMGVAMILSSLALGYADLSGYPTETLLASPALLLLPAMTNGFYIFLAPMLFLGVCVAELRYHLSPAVTAFLGHWLVVDAAFAAFAALTFSPFPGTGVYGITAAAEGMMRRCAELEGAAGAGAGAGMPAGCQMLASRPAALRPRADADMATTFAADAAQSLLFCLLLLCLSCQSCHRKRSFVVFGVLQRSAIADFCGRYSYVLYLFPQVLINGKYVQWWLCQGQAAAQCALLNAPLQSTGGAFKLLILVLGVLLALAAQRWQDAWVASAHVAMTGWLSGGGGKKRAAELAVSEQNPLAGTVRRVVRWWQSPTTAAGAKAAGGGEFESEFEDKFFNGEGEEPEKSASKVRNPAYDQHSGGASVAGV